jgi:hypothetical protein
MVWHGAVPLILNLGWALLMLIGLPATNNLTKLTYQTPDFTYTLLASGMLALGLGIVRAVWAYCILRRPSAANDHRIPIVQAE